MSWDTLPKDNLEYLLSKLKTDVLDNKVDTEAGKGLSSNDYTTADKNKLAGIAAGAEVNQNAFSNVKVGSTTIASGEKTATLELEAGSNITLTPDTANKKVVLAATDTTYSDATTSVHGLMSAADKTKLDGVADDATKTESSTTNGNIKIDGTETQVYDDSEIKGELSTDTTTIEGNPLNFTTLSAQNAKSTILSVEPVQDLHGYDKPWVGGAGKNLLPMTVDGIKAVNTSGGTWSGNTFTHNNGVKFTILTDGDNNIIGIKVNGISSGQSQFYIKLTIGLSSGTYILNGAISSSKRMYFYDGTSWYDDNGSGATFTVTSQTTQTVAIAITKGTSVSNEIFYPMIRLATVSDLTFEPYSNICPISGRTEIGILGCGKNLFDKTKATANYRVITANGTLEALSGMYASDYTVVESNTSYTMNFVYYSSANFGMAFYDINKDYISGAKQWTQEGDTTFTFTTPNNCRYIRFTIGNTTDIDDVQVEKGSTSTNYEPYTKSNDLTISLGQTVYGGTLDVENGVLVVDSRYKEFTSTGSETWYKRPNKNIFYTAWTDTAARAPSSTGTEGCFNSNYKCVTKEIDLLDNGECVNSSSAISSSNLSVGARDERYTTTEDFKASLSTPMQIVYPLTTPITINLTPNTIKLLEGVNNISTDGDKITLTYRNGKVATLDGAVPKMTFRGEDYTMGVDDIGLFLENLTKSTKTYIANPLLNFDGTVATYKKIMKQWFINNGVNIMDSTGITYLCERWYEITKQGWKGGTSFPAVGVSTGSTGTRFDDNVGMSVTPSTDTSANTDTYQGLPLFAITDCNWELDSDGNILITAIDGITDNFERSNPEKFVGVMQQTGWVKKVDDTSTQKYYYADDKNAYEDLVPLPEAIKLDGTVRSFVVHAKYMSGIVDSKMTCCSGVIPRRNISHDSLVTLPDNIGTQYSGGTSVDWSFLVWMQRIKYASLTSDGVLQGCCNYNYQYYVKVSETGVKRLILSSANGANLKVGSTVTFGAYAGNADRGQAATYSISGQDGAIITAIEDVTIDGTTYKAVYVDTASTFDTVANGDATNGTTIVSTYHWVSGSCDNVKGNDGSPVSATNGVYPARLQGIEYMVGGYEVFADVIMNISGGYYSPVYARKATDQATSITANMVESTLKCAQPSSDAWRYVQAHGFDGEIFYPTSQGSDGTKYTKDGFYMNGTGTSTGTREWLAFGSLRNGSGNAGLSCLYGNTPLGSGGWTNVARLSCNGNRGELAA